MPTTQNLWLPEANSVNANPSQFDFHKVINAQLVETARIENLLMPRLVANKASMYLQNGNLNREVTFKQIGGIGTEKHGLNDQHVGMDVDQIERTVRLDARPFKSVYSTETITRVFTQVNTEPAILQSMGYALRETTEVEVLKAICDASATTALGSENTNEFFAGGGNTSAIGTTIGQTRALKILNEIEVALLEFQSKGVPANGRNVIVSPEDYMEIIKTEKAYESATVSIAGGIYGNMDIAGPKVDFTSHVDFTTPLMYRGFLIWSSNFINASLMPHVKGLKASDHTIDPDFNNRGSTFSSAGDFSNVEGVIFQSDCVGMIDIMNNMFTQEDIPGTTNELFTAMSWIGLDTHKPHAAKTIISA